MPFRSKGIPTYIFILLIRTMLYYVVNMIRIMSLSMPDAVFSPHSYVNGVKTLWISQCGTWIYICILRTHLVVTPSIAGTMSVYQQLFDLYPQSGLKNHLTSS